MALAATWQACAQDMLSSNASYVGSINTTPFNPQKQDFLSSIDWASVAGLVKSWPGSVLPFDDAPVQPTQEDTYFSPGNNLTPTIFGQNLRSNNIPTTVAAFNFNEQSGKFAGQSLISFNYGNSTGLAASKIEQKETGTCRNLALDQNFGLTSCIGSKQYDITVLAGKINIQTRGNFSGTAFNTSNLHIQGITPYNQDTLWYKSSDLQTFQFSDGSQLALRAFGNTSFGDQRSANAGLEFNLNMFGDKFFNRLTFGSYYEIDNLKGGTGQSLSWQPQRPSTHFLLQYDAVKLDNQLSVNVSVDQSPKSAGASTALIAIDLKL